MNLLPRLIATSYTPVPDPPVNVVAPSIDNLTPTVGDTLTASNGTSTNSPSSHTYRWTRDGSTIVGETASTYLTSAPDEGAVIGLYVKPANAGGNLGEVAAAEFTAAVLAAP